MEDSLRQIAQQLQLPEVDATFALLKYADNFANTLSFEKNTGMLFNALGNNLSSDFSCCRFKK
jgi:hypothetical protein